MTVDVRGIAVDDELLGAWRRWLAPPSQPFVVDAGCDLAGEGIEPSAEDRDTFRLWRIDKAARLVWLTEDAFFALAPTARANLVRRQVQARRAAVPSVRAWSELLDARLLRSYGDRHRFVWWPPLLGSQTTEVLRRVVTSEIPLPSRHAEVDERVWQECSELLPAARTLAGTFARGSGPNCFGAVMGAAGVAGAADTWMLQEPFAEWLAAHAVPGGSDEQAGTILVWRDPNRLVRHAAVTIGGGWAFEKPSQSWAAPRIVLPVRDLIRTNRCAGQRLERHTLRGAS